MPWGAQIAPNFGFAADVAPWTASAGTASWLSTDGKTANGCLQVVVSFAGAGSSFAVRVPAGTTANMASLTGQSTKSWRSAAQCKVVSTTAGTIRARIYARAYDSAGNYIADVSLGNPVTLTTGSWVRLDQNTTVTTITTAQPTAAYVQTMIQPVNDAGDGVAGTFTLLVDEIVGQFGDATNPAIEQYLSGDGDETSNRIKSPAGANNYAYGSYWGNGSTSTWTVNIADGPSGGPSTCASISGAPTNGTALSTVQGGDPASGTTPPSGLENNGWRRIPNGSAYSGAVWIKPIGVALTSVKCRAYFRDGNGGWAGSTITTGTTAAADTWTRLTFSITPPAGAEWGMFWTQADGLTNGTTYTIRHTGWIDAANTTVPTYFDGSTSGARWAGTAHSSVSFAPTIARATSALRSSKESALSDDERVNLFPNPLPIPSGSGGALFGTEGPSSILVAADATSPTGNMLSVKPITPGTSTDCAAVLSGQGFNTVAFGVGGGDTIDIGAWCKVNADALATYGETTGATRRSCSIAVFRSGSPGEVYSNRPTVADTWQFVSVRTTVTTGRWTNPNGAPAWWPRFYGAYTSTTGTNPDVRYAGITVRKVDPSDPPMTEADLIAPGVTPGAAWRGAANASVSARPRAIRLTTVQRGDIEQPQGSRNRWPNPTFEADTVGSQPSGLTYYASGPGTSIVSQVVNSPIVEGAKSWRLAFTTSGTGQVTVGGTTQDFAVSPGDKISVSMRGVIISTVTSPYNTVACAVQWKNAAGGVISTDYPSTSPAVGPFVANLTSTAPALAVTANVRVYGQQAGPTFPYPAGTLDFVLDEVAVTTQPDTTGRAIISTRPSIESIPALDGGTNEAQNPSAVIDLTGISAEGAMPPTLARVTGGWPDAGTAVRATKTSTALGSIAVAWYGTQVAIPGVQYVATARIRNESTVAQSFTLTIYAKQSNGTTDVVLGQVTSATLQPGQETTLMASGVASALAVGAMRVRVGRSASAAGEDHNWLTTDVHLVRSIAARSVVAARPSFEPLSGLDAMTRTLVAARPVAETFSFIDTATRLFIGGQRVPVEVLNISDAIQRAISVSRVITDAATIIDSGPVTVQGRLPVLDIDLSVERFNFIVNTAEIAFNQTINAQPQWDIELTYNNHRVTD